MELLDDIKEHEMNVHRLNWRKFNKRSWRAYLDKDEYQFYTVHKKGAKYFASLVSVIGVFDTLIEAGEACQLNFTEIIQRGVTL